MSITVVGTGYVGLVTGTCFAESGNVVHCVDVDAAKIERLKRGVIPIYEPGLEEMVVRNAAAGRLKFGTDLASALQQSTIVYIAVGTPQGADGAADLKYIWDVAAGIRKHATSSKIVVIKSTVPVGTNRELASRLNDGAVLKHKTASNPEFLKEGHAIEDFMKPDRVVVGVREAVVADKLRQLYAPFLRNGHPFLVMTPESSEMTKYVANALLATKISFINDAANLCEKLDADINDVRTGIGYDQRIGFQFLYPGPGYGGSCFPKDTRALMRTAENVGARLRILEAVDQINEDQKERLYAKLLELLGSDLTGRRIALWGLAFKPNSDDIREAPSLVLIQRLLDAGATVCAFDPKAAEHVHKVFGDRIEYAEDAYSCLDGADALAVVTEWSQFRTPDFDEIKSRLARPIIVDGRNLYALDVMAENGFVYSSIGRPLVAPTVAPAMRRAA
ncbi:MAG: UDP-glucose dehydrogenase family protein [Planctomycetia bacterium]